MEWCAPRHNIAELEQRRRNDNDSTEERHKFAYLKNEIL